MNILANFLVVCFIAFDQLEYKLGYKFEDRKLLESALTHKSAENSTTESHNYIEMGKALIRFYAGDYAVRTSKANAKSGALKAHCNHLCGESVVRNIANYLQLSQLVRITPNLTIGKTPFRRYEKFVFSMFGENFQFSGV